MKLIGIIGEQSLSVKEIVYFEKQTVTLIEVNKFLKHPQKFSGDHSRLAQWLRAIDVLNRDADFSEFANDPIFKILQNEPIDKIIEYTELSEADVLAIKAEIEKQ